MAEVGITSIQDLPVVAKNISTRYVKMIAERTAAGDAQHPVAVGRVNGLLYPVAGPEVVMGLRKAKAETIRVLVTDYPSMKDLLAAHVRANYEPHRIDPLRIRDTVLYMAKTYEMSIDDVCKLLWLDRRRHLLEAVHYEILDETREILEDMVAEVSKKMSDPTIPVYYIHRLSQIDGDAQIKAAKEMRTATIANMTTDDWSYWLRYDAIKHYLEEREENRKRRALKAEEKVLKKAKLEELRKKDAKSKALDDETLKRAEKFVGDDRDLLFLAAGTYGDMLIDKKTGRIADVADKDGVVSLTDDKGLVKIVLSERAIEYLGMREKKVNTYLYSSLDKASKMLAKSKERGARCAVLTDTKVPTR